MSDRPLLQVPTITTMSDSQKLLGNDGTDAVQITKANFLKEVNASITADQLCVKSLTIPVASVVANTDAWSTRYPYKYDYTFAEITANTVAQIVMASDSDKTVYEACCDGSNYTFAGSIRCYFTKVPTATLNVKIVYQKGVTV